MNRNDFWDGMVLIVSILGFIYVTFFLEYS